MANWAVLPLGGPGRDTVTLYSYAGPVDLLVDLYGWVVDTSVSPHRAGTGELVPTQVTRVLPPTVLPAAAAPW